jgi:hypothetical protein
MRIRRSDAAAAWLFALAAIADFTTASAEPVAIGASRIPLYSFRPNDTRAGSLTYRGGLYLTSNDANFGGLSDLAVSASGDRILAISDRGRWFRARLSYDERGDLAGLSDGDLAPMLVEFGEAKRNRQRDAEGLTLERDGDLDGPVIVSFEQVSRVLRYDFSKGPETLPVPIATGPWVSSLINNRQLEALTLLSPNSLLLLGESKPPGSSDHIGAIEAYPGTSMPVSKVLSVASHDPFDITSVAKAPGGGIFMLERRFSLLGGLGAQVRFVPEHEISEGARLQGQVLMNLSFQDANIDNMEGIAVRRGKNGETFLYLISDNNFSRFQRTLLMMFEWKR